MSIAEAKQILKENEDICIIEVWILDGMATEDLIEKVTFEKRYGGSAVALWPHPVSL